MNSEAKLGKYTIIEELGRGGYGIVYKAQDSLLERYVALKVLHPNLVNDLTFVSQFLHEAKLASQLDHPNIVPVFDYDQKEGRYIIAMGLMGKGSLKDQLNKNGAISLVQAKAILEQVASGLAYAHEHNIIHRDLKPGNILIDDKGNARVSDFGFAKAMRGSSVSMSVSGGLLGTPSYMAPEIWEGKPASPASDIYSLGCITYEMLSGDVLFDGETPAQIMHAHLIRGPLPINNTPAAWHIILKRCLNPNPAERYLTADALLEDLILSKPDLLDKNICEINSKLGHYKLNSHTISLSDRNSSNQPNSEFILKKEFDFQSTKNNLLKWFFFSIVSILLLGLMVLSISQLRKNRNLAKIDAPMTFVQSETATPSRFYTNTVSLTSKSTATITKTATPTITPTFPVYGAHVISLDNANKVEELVRFGKGTMNDIEYSPDGKTIAIASSIDISLVDSQTLEVIPSFKINGSFSSVSWLPDNKTLIGGNKDGTIYFWDIMTGELKNAYHGHELGVTAMSICGEGNILASNSFSGLQLWDLTTDSILKKINNESRNKIHCSRHKTKNNILVSWNSEEIRFWDVSTGNELTHFRNFTQGVNSVSFSPNGNSIASGNSDNTIKIMFLDSRSEIITLSGHTAPINTVSFSPDGKTVASGSEDGTIRIWDINTGMEQMSFASDTESVSTVIYSPNGHNILSGSNIDGTIRLWDLSNGKKASILSGFSQVISGFSAAFSPDGNFVASSSFESKITLRNILSGEVVKILNYNDYQGFLWDVSFSPDGNLLAAITYDGIVLIWDISSGELLNELNRANGFIGRLAFSSDGTLLAVGYVDNIIVLDTTSGAEIMELEVGLNGPSSISFSPDGRLLAIGYYGKLTLWDLQTRNEIRTKQVNHIVGGLRFSPDGNMLAMSSEKTVFLLDVNTGDLVKTLGNQDWTVRNLIFSPDGKTLASGSGGKVFLWDVSSGKAITPLHDQSQSYVISIMFSLDGKSILSLSEDGVLRIWGIP